MTFHNNTVRILSALELNFIFQQYPSSPLSVKLYGGNITIKTMSNRSLNFIFYLPITAAMPRDQPPFATTVYCRKHN